MSYASIYQSTRDEPLRQRVTAGIGKETWNNPSFGDTVNGERVKTFGPQQFLEYFMWPVGIANEAAYDSALAAGNPNPGGDPAVITDGAILSAIQTNWPPDPPPIPTPEP